MSSALQEQRRLHEAGWFADTASHYLRHAGRIRDLITRTDARTLLDYGSGKGHQYSRAAVHEHWGGLLPVCYDPGVPAFAKVPEAVYDGLICIDVLEHVEAAALRGVLLHMARICRLFALIEVGLSPDVTKRLSDGRSCHVTIRPPWYWDQMVGHYLFRVPVVELCFVR